MVLLVSRLKPIDFTMLYTTPKMVVFFTSTCVPTLYHGNYCFCYVMIDMVSVMSNISIILFNNWVRKINKSFEFKLSKYLNIYTLIHIIVNDVVFWSHFTMVGSAVITWYKIWWKVNSQIINPPPLWGSIYPWIQYSYSLKTFMRLAKFPHVLHHKKKNLPSPPSGRSCP